MEGDQHISFNLICAVREGRLERVKKLISSYGLPDSEGYALLCDAVKNKHTEVVKLLLTNGSKVNNENDLLSDTHHHFAVRNGDIEIVKVLLDRGAYIDAVKSYVFTPLHIAVESKKVEIVELLLNHGACVNVRHYNNRTPLIVAAEGGSKEIVKLLLQHGACVNSAYTSTLRNFDQTVCLLHNEEHHKVFRLLSECRANVDTQDKDYKTVLCSAVETGCPVVIEYVLRHSPDVNEIDLKYKYGRTALHIAAEGGHLEVVEVLLKFGAVIDSKDEYGITALHIAVEGGHLEVVEVLLKFGAVIDSKNDFGITALHIAADKGHLEVVKVLLKIGAVIDSTDRHGRTALHTAALRCHLDIVKFLLKIGAVIYSQNEDGRTALHFAAEQGHLEVVEVLLKFGAVIDSKDKYGRTALHIAARRGHLEVVKFLTKIGAVIDSKDENDRKALHIAAEGGHVEVVEFLLKIGAVIDSKDKYGRTALHIAAGLCHVELVKFLLTVGAVIDSKEKDGRTALHVASEKRHKEIVVALLEHGSDINIMSNNIETPLNVSMNRMRPVYRKFPKYFNHLDVNNIRIISDILKSHIVKMKTAGLFVSEKNLLSISNNGEISDFQNRCEEEIAIMKCEKVSNANVSFYDILTKGISQLAMYAGNESIAQIFNSDDYIIKFPIYASMINCNFRKGEKRKELLEQGHKVFHSFFNIIPQLPNVCIEKIFSYLSDDDLRILINACKPVSVSSPNTVINNVAITSDMSKIS
jgi:ankyrin repeat protein